MKELNCFNCGSPMKRFPKHIWFISLVWLCLLIALSYYWKAEPVWSNRDSSTVVASVVSIGAAGLQHPLELIVPVDTQLRALREKDIKDAYEVTSNEFKQATTSEDFEDFVKRNPILTTHQNITVKSQAKNENKAEVVVILNPGKENALVNYQLIWEDGRWKVWSLNVQNTYSPQVTELMKDTSSMQRTVESQLQALRENDVAKAYYEYTSKDFQSAISMEGFRKFLETFPIFTKQEAVEFTTPMLDKGTGRIEVSLHNRDMELMVEYTLGIEDEQWKIWGIQVINELVNSQSLPIEQQNLKANSVPQASVLSRAASPTGTRTALDFIKIELGTSVDKKGAIINPVTTLTSPKGDIYINLYVANGVAGDHVEVRVENIETASHLPPISTSLQQSGNSVVSFSFAPPTQGWPKGNYKLEAASSTGLMRTFNFVVE